MAEITDLSLHAPENIYAPPLQRPTVKILRYFYTPKSGSLLPVDIISGNQPTMELTVVHTEIANIMHHDYLEVCKMQSSTKTKVWLLTVIFGQHPDTWRVTGVTESALEVFATHDFKSVSKMGVQRSHLVSRDETYRKMLGKPIEDFDEWWQLYYKNDQCVLATSSENNSGKLSRIIPIDVNDGMFRSRGYSWQHRQKVEGIFLRKLHQNNRR